MSDRYGSVHPARRTWLVVTVVALSSLIAACSGTTTPKASTSAPLHGLLPKSLQNTKVLPVAAASDFPPLGFYEAGDTSKIVGFQPDLSDAMGGLLGIKFQFQNAVFDSMVPSLQSGRFLMAWGGFSDTAEREKQVLLVDFVKNGGQLVVAADNPSKVSKIADLCGHSVASLKGGIWGETIEAQSSTCVKSGSRPIQIQVYPDANQASLAVAAGRATAYYDSSILAASLVSGDNAKLAAVGPVYTPRLLGVALPKDQTELANAIRAAIQQLIDDGTYGKLAAKWGLSNNVVSQAVINGSAP